jgi:hypothetical protein
LRGCRLGGLFSGWPYISRRGSRKYRTGSFTEAQGQESVLPNKFIAQGSSVQLIMPEGSESPALRKGKAGEDVQIDFKFHVDSENIRGHGVSELKGLSQFWVRKFALTRTASQSRGKHAQNRIW